MTQHTCSNCGLPAASTPERALYLPAGSERRYCQWCHPNRQPRPLSAETIDAMWDDGEGIAA